MDSRRFRIGSGDVDSMFDQMFRSMWGLTPGFDAQAESRFGTSDANLSVEPVEDGYVVLADLPGFEKEEIGLTFDEGVLTIDAEHEVEGEGFSRSRHVYEQVAIRGDVLVDEIEATYRNGVLEVHLPTEASPEEGHHIDIE